MSETEIPPKTPVEPEDKTGPRTVPAKVIRRGEKLPPLPLPDDLDEESLAALDWEPPMIPLKIVGSFPVRFVHMKGKLPPLPVDFDEFEDELLDD